MKASIVLSVLGALLSSACATNRSDGKARTNDVAKLSADGEVMELSAGQVWSYKARAGEEDSQVVICAIEQRANVGTVVHILVKGVRIPSPNAQGGYVDTISHMPFAAESVQESLLELVEEGSVPPERRGQGNR